ncbi:MAG: hypothetical protein KME21_06055 [Desmonostoc vinosum HA7617-LM4]|nr:hypothetical protein [Desmonostoc vinosum HA7617-LM4]
MALIIIFLAHLSTLTISSLAWIDEVQTIEFGRRTLEPYSDWSLNWSVQLDRPIVLLSYLGATLQELAFRASNLSMIGPRLASLIGAMIAATIFLGYLLSRKTPKQLAWLLALIFVLEPMFVHSYRGVRVDCWALALCFSSCSLLRLAIDKTQKAQTSTWLVALAGSFAITGIIVWPSAILLYPLIGVEFIELILKVQALDKSGKLAVKQIIAFILGGVITAGLLVIPIWQQLTMALSDLKLISSSDRTLRERYDILSEISIIFHHLASTYNISPLIPITAVVGIIHARDKKLVFATLLVAIFLLSTKVYAFRAIYFLPYVLCLASSTYQSFKETAKTNFNRVFSGLLILLLTWCFVLSLIVRPATALIQKDLRNPNILYQSGTSLIGAGSQKVYINPLELYYAGRSLGWKMFFPFDINTLDLQNQQDHQALKRFFTHVDFAIITPAKIKPEMIERIEGAGLRQQKSFTLGPTNNRYTGQTPNTIKSQPYGPYTLYGRN